MFLVGFDVGGTFIDLFAFDAQNGRITSEKVDSARTQLGTAIANGVTSLLEHAGAAPADVSRIAHGTTVVTNQIVEGNGARVGLVATKGFRDVLEIGRMRRSSLADLGDSRPEPLAARDVRVEVSERTDAGGEVLAELDEDEAERAVRSLVERGIESVAVCMLHAYANPAHERAVGAICERLGVPVSLSSEVAPEYGEYERWSTTVLNSYVMPRTKAYLDELSGRLHDLGLVPQLEIMQSSGGAVPAQIAGRFPVRLVESGPCAGVTAASQIAAEAGLRKIVALDMGGTSADVAIVVDGEPHFVANHDIKGLPLRTVGIDVRSIGAGGGSIASVDSVGNLQVGPASAGADPGPACYGRGGTDATITDADVALGYLDPDGFCGGTRKLLVEEARRALAEIGKQVQASVEEVALGIVRIAVTRMAGAIRTITTQAGHDPRDCTLVAFGGAGPTHAALLADELEIAEVLVPAEPGLLSARGLLMADYRSDAYRSLPMRLADANPGELSRNLASLEEQAREHLRRAAVDQDGVRVEHVLELCYEGQQDLIPIGVEELPLSGAALGDVARRLDQTFENHYGFLPPERRPVLQRIRATALGSHPRPPLALRQNGARPDSPSERRRDLLIEGSQHSGRIIERAELNGSAVPGPCVIQETYASTVVPPGWTVSADDWGNLRLRKTEVGTR